MTTALSIIERAYALIGARGIGETVSAEDAQFALSALNSLVDSWNTDRLYIVTVQNVTASVSASSATVGTGQTFSIAAPVALERGGYTRIGGVDYPVTPISRQEYAGISDKASTGSYPDCAYFDPAGTVYFYPVPSSAVSVSLPFRVSLTEFADLATDYSLAKGYRRALEYSLAEELAPGFGGLSPMVLKNGASARRAIRITNTEVPPMTTGLEVERFDITRGY